MASGSGTTDPHNSVHLPLPNCVDDPNFATICSFLENFGETCHIGLIPFDRLQKMLEDTTEVAQDLSQIHIILLRRIYKSINTEKWEKHLAKFCHSYNSQDAWEIERFGYKKSKIQTKLRLLKNLMESQFDFNVKFKNEVNKLSADTLRRVPLGRDSEGQVYWYQVDAEANLRIYREDVDDDTWQLVATSREEMTELINQLANGIVHKNVLDVENGTGDVSPKEDSIFDPAADSGGSHGGSSVGDDEEDGMIIDEDSLPTHQNSEANECKKEATNTIEIGMTLRRKLDNPISAANTPDTPGIIPAEQAPLTQVITESGIKVLEEGDPISLESKESIVVPSKLTVESFNHGVVDPEADKFSQAGEGTIVTPVPSKVATSESPAVVGDLAISQRTLYCKATATQEDTAAMPSEDTVEQNSEFKSPENIGIAKVNEISAPNIITEKDQSSALTDADNVEAFRLLVVHKPTSPAPVESIIPIIKVPTMDQDATAPTCEVDSEIISVTVEETLEGTGSKYLTPSQNVASEIPTSAIMVEDLVSKGAHINTTLKFPVALKAHETKSPPPPLVDSAVNDSISSQYTPMEEEIVIPHPLDSEMVTTGTGVTDLNLTNTADFDAGTALEMDKSKSPPPTDSSVATAEHVTPESVLKAKKIDTLQVQLNPEIVGHADDPTSPKREPQNTESTCCVGSRATISEAAAVAEETVEALQVQLDSKMITPAASSLEESKFINSSAFPLAVLPISNELRHFGRMLEREIWPQSNELKSLLNKTANSDAKTPFTADVPKFLAPLQSSVPAKEISRVPEEIPTIQAERNSEKCSPADDSDGADPTCATSLEGFAVTANEALSDSILIVTEAVTAVTEIVSEASIAAYSGTRVQTAEESKSPPLPEPVVIDDEILTIPAERNSEKFSPAVDTNGADPTCATSLEEFAVTANEALSDSILIVTEAVTAVTEIVSEPSIAAYSGIRVQTAEESKSPPLPEPVVIDDEILTIPAERNSEKFSPAVDTNGADPTCATSLEDFAVTANEALSDSILIVTEAVTAVTEIVSEASIAAYSGTRVQTAEESKSPPLPEPVVIDDEIITIQAERNSEKFSPADDTDSADPTCATPLEDFVVTGNEALSDSILIVTEAVTAVTEIVSEASIAAYSGTCVQTAEESKSPPLPEPVVIDDEILTIQAERNSEKFSPADDTDSADPTCATSLEDFAVTANEALSDSIPIVTEAVTAVTETVCEASIAAYSGIRVQTAEESKSPPLPEPVVIDDEILTIQAERNSEKFSPADDTDSADPTCATSLEDFAVTANEGLSDSILIVTEAVTAVTEIVSEASMAAYSGTCVQTAEESKSPPLPEPVVIDDEIITIQAERNSEKFSPADDTDSADPTCATPLEDFVVTGNEALSDSILIVTEAVTAVTEIVSEASMAAYSGTCVQTAEESKSPPLPEPVVIDDEILTIPAERNSEKFSPAVDINGADPRCATSLEDFTVTANEAVSDSILIVTEAVTAVTEIVSEASIAAYFGTRVQTAEESKSPPLPEPVVIDDEILTIQAERNSEKFSPADDTDSADPTCATSLEEFAVTANEALSDSILIVTEAVTAVTEIVSEASIPAYSGTRVQTAEESKSPPLSEPVVIDDEILTIQAERNSEKFSPADDSDSADPTCATPLEDFAVTTNEALSDSILIVTEAVTAVTETVCEASIAAYSVTRVQTAEESKSPPLPEPVVIDDKILTIQAERNSEKFSPADDTDSADPTCATSLEEFAVTANEALSDSILIVTEAVTAVTEIVSEASIAAYSGTRVQTAEESKSPPFSEPVVIDDEILKSASKGEGNSAVKFQLDSKAHFKDAAGRRSSKEPVLEFPGFHENTATAVGNSEALLVMDPIPKSSVVTNSEVVDLGDSQSFGENCNFVEEQMVQEATWVTGNSGRITLQTPLNIGDNPADSTIESSENDTTKVETSAANPPLGIVAEKSEESASVPVTRLAGLGLVGYECSSEEEEMAAIPLQVVLDQPAEMNDHIPEVSTLVTAQGNCKRKAESSGDDYPSKCPKLDTNVEVTKDLCFKSQLYEENQIVGDTIEEDVIFIRGEGSGADLEGGNTAVRGVTTARSNIKMHSVESESSSDEDASPVTKKRAGRPRGRKSGLTKSGDVRKPGSGRKPKLPPTQDLDESSNASANSTPTSIKKKTNGRLNIEVPTRQSSRIAKIQEKEEEQRRRLEEERLAQLKAAQLRKQQLQLEREQKQTKQDDDVDSVATKQKGKGRPSKNTSKYLPTPSATESDDEEIQSVIQQSKKRGRKRKHQEPPKTLMKKGLNPWIHSSSEDDDEVVEEEEEHDIHEEEEEDLTLRSDHEFSPESDMGEDDEDASPSRHARTVKRGETKEDKYAETNCDKCGKGDHPEWILLCDACDKGWHASCLRPVTWVIPEGQWFCPPCQHKMLIEKLNENLSEYDKVLKKHELEVLRKQRLAYVDISLANVLPKEDQNGKDVKKNKKRRRQISSDDEEDELMAGSGGHGFIDEREDSSNLSKYNSDESDDEPMYKLRARKATKSFNFKEYDELINSALRDEDEYEMPAAGGEEEIKTVPATHENGGPEGNEPPPPKLVSNKGKVMPGTSDDEEEEVEKKPERWSDEEEVDEDEKKRRQELEKQSHRKSRRRLNDLDATSDEDSDEDFKGSEEDDEEDEAYAVEDEDSDWSGDRDGDDSDDSIARKGKKSKLGRQEKYLDVGSVRRSSRKARSRIIYDESDQEDDEDEPAGGWGSENEESGSTVSESDDETWGKRKKKKPVYNPPSKLRKSSFFLNAGGVTSKPKSKGKSSPKKKKKVDEDEIDRAWSKHGGKVKKVDAESSSKRSTRGKQIDFKGILESGESDDDGNIHPKRKKPTVPDLDTNAEEPSSSKKLVAELNAAQAQAAAKASKKISKPKNIKPVSCNIIRPQKSPNAKATKNRKPSTVTFAPSGAGRNTPLKKKPKSVLSSSDESAEEASKLAEQLLKPIPAPPFPPIGRRVTAPSVLPPVTPPPMVVVVQTQEPRSKTPPPPPAPHPPVVVPVIAPPPLPTVSQPSTNLMMSEILASSGPKKQKGSPSTGHKGAKKIKQPPSPPNIPSQLAGTPRSQVPITSSATVTGPVLFPGKGTPPHRGLSSPPHQAHTLLPPSEISRVPNPAYYPPNQGMRFPWDRNIGPPPPPYQVRGAPSPPHPMGKQLNNSIYPPPGPLPRSGYIPPPPLRIPNPGSGSGPPLQSFQQFKREPPGPGPQVYRMPPQGNPGRGIPPPNILAHLQSSHERFFGPHGGFGGPPPYGIPQGSLYPTTQPQQFDYRPEDSEFKEEVSQQERRAPSPPPASKDENKSDGEFGGLVSYFSSQRGEEDMDT